MIKKNSDTGQKSKESEADIALKDKEEKINRLINDLKRVQAEFENYQKRIDKQNDEYKKYASVKLIEELLPVLDSLEQGIKHNKDFVQVYNQLFSVLKKNGLEKIVVRVGDKFDHDLMDCMMKEENKDLGDGVVSQILSTGYLLNGKVLRPVRVCINQLENPVEKEEKFEEKEKDKISDEKNSWGYEKE